MFFYLNLTVTEKPTSIDVHPVLKYLKNSNTQVKYNKKVCPAPKCSCVCTCEPSEVECCDCDISTTTPHPTTTSPHPTTR